MPLSLSVYICAYARAQTFINSVPSLVLYGKSLGVSLHSKLPGGIYLESTR